MDYWSELREMSQNFHSGVCGVGSTHSQSRTLVSLVLTSTRLGTEKIIHGAADKNVDMYKREKILVTSDLWSENQFFFLKIPFVCCVGLSLPPVGEKILTSVQMVKTLYIYIFSSLS